MKGVFVFSPFVPVSSMGEFALACSKKSITVDPEILTIPRSSACKNAQRRKQWVETLIVVSEAEGDAFAGNKNS